MKLTIATMLVLMVFITTALASEQGGLPAVSKRVTSLETQIAGVIQRVETLENAKPAYCPCFDAVLLSQYQWAGQFGMGAAMIDEEGNSISSITLWLEPKAGDDKASINRVDKVSPTGQMLSSSFSCSFTDSDRPDQTGPSDPAYDPNFPFAIAENTLTLKEYQACSDTMADLARRRGF